MLQFKSLKSKSTQRLEAKKAEAIRRAESTNDEISDIDEEEGFEFHKEVYKLNPKVAEQLGIFEAVKKKYDLEFHPQRSLQ